MFTLNYSNSPTISHYPFTANKPKEHSRTLPYKAVFTPAFFSEAARLMSVYAELAASKHAVGTVHSGSRLTVCRLPAN